MTGQPDADRNQDADLGSRVAAAAGWMVGFRWIDRLIGLASVAILARILVPEDFGIVGYATLVAGILELFAGIATDAELIRHRHADHAYYNAAWTMNVLRGLAIAALMAALAVPAGTFFREPRLAAVMLALASIPLIRAFENVGIVDFRKHLQFNLEFRYLLTSRMLGTVATIALALSMRSYWALAIGIVVRTALGVALSYAFHPFRPRFNFARVPEIFRFSRWMMLQTLAAGVNEKLPALAVGRGWGSSDLAFFNIGKEIADLSATEIRAPIRRALYPGLARIADRRLRLREVLVESTAMLALLTVPIPLGIALVAEDFVPLFLGPQWHATVSVLQPLCIAASVTALGTNSPLALMALNRSHLTAIAAFVRLMFLLAAVVIASPQGVVAIAYAVAGVSCVMLIADYALSARVLEIDARRFAAVIWRPITASLAMCAAVWLLRAGYPARDDLSGHAWSLVRSSLLGAVVYVTCVLSLWAMGGRRGAAERRLFETFRDLRARFGKRAT